MLVRLVSDLYGAGIERMVVLARRAQPGAARAAGRRRAGRRPAGAARRCIPESLRDRVEGALASVRPMLQGHEGDVELLDIDEEVGAVRLRLLGQLRRLPVVGGDPAAARSSGPSRRGARDRASSTSTSPTPTAHRSVPIALGRKPTYERVPVRAGRVRGGRLMSAEAGPLAAIARIREQPAPPLPRPGERCEMCGEEVADEHGHVVDLEARTLHVHLPGLLPAVHARRAPAAGTSGRCRDRCLAFPDLALSPGPVGRAADPGERRLLLRELDLDRVARLLPEPGGRHRVAAVARDVGRGGRRQPRARPRSSPTSRRSSSAPIGAAGRPECFLVPDRRLLRAGRQLRRLWRGFDGGQRGAARPSTRSSPRSREPGGADERARLRGRSRPGPSRTPRSRPWCCGCASPRRPARPCTPIALQLPDPDRAAAPHATSRRGGAALRAVRRPAAVGRLAAAVPVDPRRRRWSRLHRLDRGRPAGRVLVRLRGGGGTSTCTRLDDGEIPLPLLFSGTVFARRDGGFSAEPVSWNVEATFRLPVQVWREVMDLYFPNSGWVRLSRDDARRLAAVQGRARPARLGPGLRAAPQGGGERGDRPRPADRVRRRPRGGRRGAVRGLRAVPVPGLGGQEPAALAVRRAGPPGGRRRPTGPSGGRLPHRVHRRPGPGRPTLDVRVRFLQVQHRTVEALAPDGGVRARSTRSTVDGVRWMRRGTRRSSTRSTSTRSRSSPVAGAVDGRAPARPAARRSRLSSRRDGALRGRSCAVREPSTGGCGSTADWADGPGPYVAGRGRASSNTPSAATPAAPATSRCAARWSACTRCSPSTTARSCRSSTRPTDAAEAAAGCRSDGTYPVLVGDGTGRRRRAVVADHPLRPPGRRPREPGRHVRRHRDRRDPGPAGAHAHRRGEGRGPRHRRPRRGDRRPVRRHAAGGLGAPPRHRSAPSAAGRRRRRPSRSRAVVGAGRRTPRSTRGPTRCASAASTSPRAPGCGCDRRGGPTPTTCSSPAWTATVAGVFHDVDGELHVAVTVDDDPASTELDWQGRYLFFHPDEIEVARVSGRPGCSSPGSATSSSATTASASRWPTGSRAMPCPRRRAHRRLRDPRRPPRLRAARRLRPARPRRRAADGRGARHGRAVRARGPTRRGRRPAPASTPTR